MRTSSNLFATRWVFQDSPTGENRKGFFKWCLMGLVTSKILDFCWQSWNWWFANAGKKKLLAIKMTLFQMSVTKIANLSVRIAVLNFRYLYPRSQNYKPILAYHGNPKNGISPSIISPICWWHWCWWHRYVGDFMMVTHFRCWWQNHNIGGFFRYVGDFLNVLNRSPTSRIGHQHLKLVTNTFGLQHPSPTSM